MVSLSERLKMVRAKVSLLSEEVKRTLLFLRYFWIFENRFLEVVEIVVIFLIFLMIDCLYQEYSHKCKKIQ